MKTSSIARWRALFVVACLTPAASIAVAQGDPNVKFTFQTFPVTGAVTLSVEYVNNAGTISGYFTDASNDTEGFWRASDGAITTYVEPADTTSPAYTQGNQINKNGMIAGEFYDTGANAYEGYLYSTTAGNYKTYQAPDQPQYTTTALEGINDNGDLCGFVQPPPYTVTSGFVKIDGVVTIFSVDSSTTTLCSGINDSGTAVGYYVDSSGVSHGFARTSSGIITTIDAPGASTTPGSAPCTGTTAGTIVIGINNAGSVSGHYWDTSYNEHGFIISSNGKFIPVNYPGAYQTSGGGLNDHDVMVGHYDDSSCNQNGYIATP
ncbi:MAG: hypothetical protein ABSH50_03420 [Bryobacteraceae bacterium]|jgi:hypothetical protein